MAEQKELDIRIDRSPQNNENVTWDRTVLWYTDSGKTSIRVVGDDYMADQVARGLQEAYSQGIEEGKKQIREALGIWL